jgi:hypothetical protein
LVLCYNAENLGDSVLLTFLLLGDENKGLNISVAVPYKRSQYETN